MALGGGNFVYQSKVLPGVYINFASLKANNGVVGERGTVAVGLTLDWGDDSIIIELKAEDFERKSLVLFGYHHNHESLKPIRDIFKNANKLLIFKLNSGGTKATNNLATAILNGTRGNSLSVAIQQNVDQSSKFDVITYLGDEKVDIQTVSKVNELYPNDFVEFKMSQLQATQKTPLTSGSNGSVNNQSHQTFLDNLEGKNFNALIYAGTDSQIAKLYINFTKRMRDEVGLKFQTVLYNTKADYEGVVNVKNTCKDNETALVYWTAGAIAGCPISTSVLNKTYNGEYTVTGNYTQRQLEQSIEAGEFVFHKVGNEYKVLEDINSLTTPTAERGYDFQSNQTVRVIDQIATDIANLFNSKYSGQIQNNEAGRLSLWADIVKHHEELQRQGAIENFKAEDVKVEAGRDKKSVVISDAVFVTSAMSKIYMVVKVG